MRPTAPYRPSTDWGASPRVSVITIFLNEERFLAEAIGSVLAQTYGDWELLLCDDGSTDGSTDIARAYVKAHPDRIRYLQHPGGENRGMSATRNLGLAHARGEFVAFLDGDDVWLPQKLEEQVATLDAHPKAAMTFGPSLWWHGWNPHSTDEDAETVLCVAPTGVVRGERMLVRILQMKGDPLFTCSVLARRSAVQEVGGFEERFTGLFEDQVFFSKLLLAHDVFVTSKVLDYYRQHPASCCAIASQGGGTRSSRLLEARRAYLQWLYAYVADRGTRLRWRVRREYWLHQSPPMAYTATALRVGVRNARGRAVALAFEASRHLLPRALRTSAWDLWTRARAHP